MKKVIFVSAILAALIGCQKQEAPKAPAAEAPAAAPAAPAAATPAAPAPAPATDKK